MGGRMVTDASSLHLMKSLDGWRRPLGAAYAIASLNRCTVPQCRRCHQDSLIRQQLIEQS